MKARFTIRPLLALFAALAFLSPAGLAQGRAARAPEKAARIADEKSGSFSVRDGQRLRLFAEIGNIRIRTQNSGQVSYRVRIEADARQPDAQLYLSKFVLSARAMPDGVSINARAPRHDFRAGAGGRKSEEGSLWVTFELNVPRNFQLEITTQAGNIETESIDGRITLVTGGGNLSAGRVGGAARLETRGGDITVQDVAADLRALSGGGHLTVGTVQGDAVMRTGGGHIRVAAVQGTAQLETGGGNISLERAGGGIIAHTRGGRIDLGETSGPIRASTGGGNIGVLNVVGPAQLDTGSGSISLTQVQGAIRASTAAGTITAWFGPLADAEGKPEGKLQGPSQLETGAGDILVYIPRELAVSIDATVESAAEDSLPEHWFPSSRSGGIGTRRRATRIDADPDIPLKMTYTGSRAAGRTVRAEAVVNGGGEVLRLKTVTGHIRLRYSDSPAAAGLSIAPNLELLRRQIELRLNMHPEDPAEPAQAGFAQGERGRAAGRQREVHKRLAEKQQESRPEASGGEQGRDKREELSRLQEWRWKIMRLWSDRLRVDASEQKQRLIWSSTPAYPFLARRQRIEGVVRLDVYISGEGTVEDVQVRSGQQILARAAMEAVKQWRYAPVTVDNKPVPVVTTVNVAFRLN